MSPENFFHPVLKIYENTIFIYCLVIFAVQILLMILARLEIRRNVFVNKFWDIKEIEKSAVIPGISVIAPAYNESSTIIDNVRSLLTLYYPKFELIIVNDGSTDDTLQKLIDAYSLIEVDYSYEPAVLSQPIRGFYKSTNKAYKHLLVIDKVNGKCKADAINAGLNAAVFPYFLNTDVDCILHRNTLLYLIRPFLTEQKRVLAVGAAIRMVNSSHVDGGLITGLKPPRNIWARFQEMEYIRAFVMAKVGWSRLNAVPNISGALGLFDKEVVLNVGGYDPGSLGEDMDITIRMVKYACRHKFDYIIKQLPQTLCWTEGPETLRVLKRQRVRWARGLWQLFWRNLHLLFNPRYRATGLIMYPYTFFFELFAPILESIGIIYYIVQISSGTLPWTNATILLIFIYCFSVFISTISVLYDQLVFHQEKYKKLSEVIGIALMVFIEPLLYHPFVLYCSLTGYLSQCTKLKPVWGNMQRKGFKSDSEPPVTDPESSYDFQA
ncbi:MAG: glycosyltransferase family 2 protein [Niabella sp.]|nr:glycosyltransferase family 2 protein [Niabella sp.]